MSKVKQKKSRKNIRSALVHPTTKSVSHTNADIFKIFAETQWTDAFHDKYIKQLRSVYGNTPFHIFVADFIKCLKNVFINRNKNIEKNLELILSFASKFTVSLADPESDEISPFVMKVFQFLLENHDCYDTYVRLHCCQFINCLFNTLGPNASLDVALCDSISTAMMERLQDKIASVRRQAVYALHRLQEPCNPNCKVVEVFLYHMTRDPSPDVRCAVINSVVVTQKVLTVILSRINDCKDDVRKEAYVVCSKISVQKFRIKQRQLMLNCGFLDPSDKVKNFVKTVLLPKWLTVYKDDYALLLRALNVLSDVGLEVAIKSLLAIFSQHEKCELIDYLLNRMKLKTIPYDCLSPEIVLYWRVLAEYLLPPRDSEDSSKDSEIFEKIMPDLTFFSDYVKGFFTFYNFSGSSAGSDDANNIEKEFILIHLLEMTKCYDLADEFGRRNLSQVCIVLLKDPQVTIKSVPIIINRLSWAMPDVTERIEAIVELISDLREPFFDMDTTNNSSFGEKRNIGIMKTRLMERLKLLENERLEASRMEDMMIFREIEKEIITIEQKLAELQRKSVDIPSQSQEENTNSVVATKVLKIINEMIDSRDVTQLTPTLRSLFDNVVLPSFKRNMQIATISVLSLETFGLFCLLDPDLARDRFIVFCFLISNCSLTVPALKAVFDLLQKYGLKMFSLGDEDDEENDSRSVNGSRDSGKPDGKYVIPLLYSLLDSETAEVRNIAATGLCKLLLTGHLRSHTLVAKLITLWFNPNATDDPPFRQLLSLFFRSFVKTRGAQYILKRAFLPTLQLFFDADPDGSLSEIDVHNVARLLINLTHPEFGASLSKGYSVHNSLAVLICDELLQNTKTNREKRIVLIKALSLLTLQSNDLGFINELIDKGKTLTNKYQSMREKQCQRYAMKFNVKLDLLKREAETKLVESEICNTLSASSDSKNEAIASTSRLNSNAKLETVGTKVEVNVLNDQVIEPHDLPNQVSKTMKVSLSLSAESNKEVSDSDSVESSESNYLSYRKKKLQNESDDSIVILSSGEDDLEEEPEKVSDMNEKQNLRSRNISSIAKQNSSLKKIFNSFKKPGEKSSSLSQVSLEVGVDAEKTTVFQEKSNLRSSNSSVSQEESKQETISRSINKKRALKFSSSQSLPCEMDVQQLSVEKDSQSSSSSAVLRLEKIESLKVNDLSEEMEIQNVFEQSLMSNSLSLNFQEEIEPKRVLRSVQKKKK